jgi:hypothetical protein
MLFSLLNIDVYERDVVVRGNNLNESSMVIGAG